MANERLRKLNPENLDPNDAIPVGSSEQHEEASKRISSSGKSPLTVFSNEGVIVQGLPEEMQKVVDAIKAEIEKAQSSQNN
jgi:hypothetical protein